MSSHTNQSISDDQELAKVLAGVSQEADNNMQFEETGSVAAPYYEIGRASCRERV